MVVKLRSKLVRNEEGTENRSDCNMKKKNILQVVLNSRAYFGRLSPRKQNEHMLIGGKKKKKNPRINH